MFYSKLYVCVYLGKGLFYLTYIFHINMFGNTMALCDIFFRLVFSLFFTYNQCFAISSLDLLFRESASSSEKDFVS